MALYIPARPTCEIGTNRITLEGNVPLDLELNPGKIAEDRALLPSVLRVFRTAEGISYVGASIRDVLMIVDQTGLAHSGAAAHRFADGAAVLTTFPRLPGLWVEVKKSADAIRAPKIEQTKLEYQRKWDKGVHNVCEAVSSTAKATTTILSLSAQNTALLEPIRPFLSSVSLVGSVSSLKMDIEDLAAVNRAIAGAKGVSEECQNVLYETKKRKLLALAKNVCSVAAALSGIILIATGVGVIPGIALLVLGLSGTIFALWGKIHEEGMRWKPIDFFGGKHVKQISPIPC
jgi:hypothetical protein